MRATPKKPGSQGQESAVREGGRKSFGGDFERDNELQCTQFKFGGWLWEATPNKVRYATALLAATSYAIWPSSRTDGRLFILIRPRHDVKIILGTVGGTS
jgi:hypothetical protein